MASVGQRQLCSVDMAGPHPTPQLGTVGRKQEAHSHPDSQPSSVSAPGQAGRVAEKKTTDPPADVKGRKLGVTPCLELGWNSLKTVLFKGEQGSPIPWARPFHKALLNPEDTLSRTAAFGPCPPSVVGSQPRVSCSQGRTGSQRSARSEQKSQPPPVFVHTLCDLSLGRTCIWSFVLQSFCLFDFCFEGVGGIQSS